MAARPLTKAALGAIPGVGEAKLARYGDGLLALLAPALADPVRA